MPNIPSVPPRKIKPNFNSRNGAENSSFGIARAESAVIATTTTTTGLTRFAETAACPIIRPPTIPIVPPSGPGARTPASLTLSNAISINNVSIRPGNGTPLLAFAKDKIRFVGNTCV